MTNIHWKDANISLLALVLKDGDLTKETATTRSITNSMKLICKHTHNAFKKGEVYEGIEVHNAIMFIREEDQKKFFYGLKRQAGVDFIETWFWNLEEWREERLKEIL
jgi:hypothetical protein